MRIYGAIHKVEPQDDGTVRVHGIASTESVDDQGEVVRASAIKDAIPDYMRFPAIREMHQLSAAGTALQVSVGDDKITRLVAHVVDPVAVSKVKNQVYRGFSIGGRVTQRETTNPKTITGLVLNEISLVDRPANPEAVFDCWKASSMPDGLATLGDTEAGRKLAALASPMQIWACGDPAHQHTAKSEALKCIEKRAAPPSDASAHNPEEQMHKAGDAPGDASKPYGDVRYADPGHQADGKKRYPIDTEAHIRAAWNYINKPKNAGKYSAKDLAAIKARIVAAWKDKIDSDGPPSASEKSSYVDLTKSMWDIGEAAELCVRLRAMCERLEIEAAMEGDDSATANQCAALCRQSCEFLQALVAEETAEVLEGTEIDEPVGAEMGEVMMSAIISTLRKGITDTQRAEALVTIIEKLGARHNAADKALLDTAGYAITRAMGIGSAKRGEMASMVDAHKAVLDAGATNLGADGREILSGGDKTPMQGAGEATQHSTTDTGRNPATAVPNATGAVPATPVPGEAQQGNQKASFDLKSFIERLGKASDPIAFVDGMIKAGAGHVALCSLAHDGLAAASDGTTCKQDAARPARHSGRDWGNMIKAHDYLMQIDGIQCAASEVPGGEAKPEGEGEGQGTSTTAGGAGGDLGAPGSHKSVATDDLAKAVEAGVTSIAKAFAAELGGRLEAMQQKLDATADLTQKIADTPLPPAAMARVPNTVAKAGGGGGDDLDPDMLAVARVAAMDPTTKALHEIKLAKRNSRIELHGVTDGPGPWRPPLPPKPQG